MSELVSLTLTGVSSIFTISVTLTSALNSTGLLNTFGESSAISPRLLLLIVPPAFISTKSLLPSRLNAIPSLRTVLFASAPAVAPPSVYAVDLFCKVNCT